MYDRTFAQMGLQDQGPSSDKHRTISRSVNFGQIMWMRQRVMGICLQLDET